MFAVDIHNQFNELRIFKDKFTSRFTWLQIIHLMFGLNFSFDLARISKAFRLPKNQQSFSK